MPTVSDGIVDGPASPSLSKLGLWGLDPGFGAPERALERRKAAATPPMGVRGGVECCSLRIAIERRSGRAISLPERRVEPHGAKLSACRRLWRHSGFLWWRRLISGNFPFSKFFFTF